MPPEIPDLPDDYQQSDEASRADLAITVLAGLFLLAVAIGAAVLIGALS